MHLENLDHFDLFSPSSDFGEVLCLFWGILQKTLFNLTKYYFSKFDERLDTKINEKQFFCNESTVSKYIMKIHDINKNIDTTE